MPQSRLHLFDLLLHVFLPHALNIHTIQHGELCREVLAELHIFFLAFLDVLEFYGCEALVQVLKQLSVFLSIEEGRDQGFLLLFEGDKLLQLLLLKFIPDQLHVLAEIADLGNFLFFRVCKLLIDRFYVFFDLLLGLKEASPSRTLLFCLRHLLEILLGELGLGGVEVAFIEVAALGGGLRID